MELQLEFGDYYLMDENDNTIATTDKIMLKVDGSIKKLCKENCDDVYGGEFEMVTVPNTGIPKLDENNCVILTKKLI
jgi:hypothetical protein